MESRVCEDDLEELRERYGRFSLAAAKTANSDFGILASRTVRE